VMIFRVDTVRKGFVRCKLFLKGHKSYPVERKPERDVFLHDEGEQRETQQEEECIYISSVNALCVIETENVMLLSWYCIVYNIPIPMTFT